jgi:hypothetical protein
MFNGLLELDEATDSRLEAERAQQLQHPSGLGPDDLVTIVRVGSSVQPAKSPPLTTSHHLVLGLALTSPSAFLDYYGAVGELQLSTNRRLPPAQRRQLVRAVLRVFNSFLGVDHSVEISSSGLQTTAGDSEWEQLRLSSLLRYLRGPFPLFGHSPPVFPAATTVITVTSPLTRSDIEFVAHNHDVSNDLCDALARMLLLSLDAAGLVSFLDEFEHKFPGLFQRITELLPPSSELVDVVAFYAEHHWQFFPDDLQSAVVVANYYIDNKKLEKLAKFVPLLRSAVWDDPLSAVTLARVAVAECRFTDALHFLNAASFVAGNDTRPVARVLGELRRRLGLDDFGEVLVGFLDGRESAGGRSQAALPRSEASIDSIGCDSPDEFFLFDPGVAADAAWSAEMARAPLAWGLELAIAKTATAARGVRDALHAGDTALAAKLFTAALKSGTATADDCVAIFAAVITDALAIQDVWLAAEPRDAGPAERNAVAFARGLAIAFTRARR